MGRGQHGEDLLEQYGLRGRTVLMTLGRLAADERYKGIDEVLDVLPALRAKHPGIAYLVVGDGSDRARLQDRVEKHGLGGVVQFTGRIEEAEKADHYRLADAFVMPSRGEGFGFVFLEAMACGIPVVASATDGGREAVRNGMLGELVDPRDRASLIRGIRSALARARGRVPEGLDYFATPAFEARLRMWLTRSIFGG